MKDLPQLLLDQGRVHVWFVCPEKADDPDLIKAYHELMSQDEKKKQARYRFAKHRHDSLITRALARCVLSRYCTKKPHEWEFCYNKHGKPQIVRGPDDLPLKFNLSHTKGLVACVVALDQDVGIDVEYTRKKTDVSKIAARFFSPTEARTIKELPRPVQKKMFFNIWTLKESYIKARGKGLSIGLDRFSFYLSEAGVPRVFFDKSLENNPDSWRFFLLEPTKAHKAAIALRKQEGSAEPEIIARFIIPMVHEELIEVKI